MTLGRLGSREERGAAQSRGAGGGRLRPDDPDRFGTQAFYASIGRAFVAMCAVVPVLFLVEVLDRWSGDRLQSLGGVRPRHLTGLDGVLFSPFLHTDFVHLYSNSVPLILLGTFVLAAGVRRFVLSTAVIMLFSGLGVWFTGSPYTIVVGASGVIFGYLGLLFARGIVERSLWNVGVALLIALLYGWQLLGVLPTDPQVSWRGHLFGLLGGLVAAVLFRRRSRRSGRTPGTTAARRFRKGLPVANRPT
ncbi:MAG TPA: rhomboid family intramembrane serine protease [Micromonosporaceae bacterium]|nr:rhomboid family intramembrane serine protease [Micromonosporaceae bacterium]